MSVGTSSMMEQSAIIPEVVEQPIIEADPDEPRYCICNEVAFGDMVACDYKKVRLSDFISSFRCVSSVFHLVYVRISVSLRMVSLSMRWNH